MPASPATDVNAQLVGAGVETALERAHYRRGNSGGVPVHAHHATESLEPERIAQARKQFRRAVVIKDALANAGAELCDALGEPGRHSPAMQRQISYSGALHVRIMTQMHGESFNPARLV